MPGKTQLQAPAVSSQLLAVAGCGTTELPKRRWSAAASAPFHSLCQLASAETRVLTVISRGSPSPSAAPVLRTSATITKMTEMMNSPPPRVALAKKWAGAANGHETQCYSSAAAKPCQHTAKSVRIASGGPPAANALLPGACLCWPSHPDARCTKRTAQPHPPDCQLLVHVPTRCHSRNLGEQVWRARCKGEQRHARHVRRHAQPVRQELVFGQRARWRRQQRVEGIGRLIDCNVMRCICSATKAHDQDENRHYCSTHSAAAITVQHSGRTHLQRRDQKVLGHNRHEPEQDRHPGCKGRWGNTLSMRDSTQSLHSTGVALQAHSIAFTAMHSTCLLHPPACCTRLTNEPKCHQRAPIVVRAVKQRQVGDVVHVCLAGAVPLHKRALVRHVGEVGVALLQVGEGGGAY